MPAVFRFTDKSILLWLLTLAILGFPNFRALRADETKALSPVTQNVVLITIDGLRWQEVFFGAEERLISSSEGKVKEVDAIRSQFWREQREERRESLMPFLWREIATKGQVIGNRERKSLANVTNRHHFSYPGYSELLCGFADARIASNDPIPNPNISVLEWLARRPSIGLRVAAFGSWDVFPAILNEQRSGIYVNAGWKPFDVARDAQELVTINRLMHELPRTWKGVRFDAITAYGAREYLQIKRPRVLYVSLGEPDDWAHEGRYDLYLQSTRHCDELIEGLWRLVQELPEYAGKTTLVLTTDHGRGRAGDGWKNHSVSIDGSDEIWFAILGPDTEPLGERSECTITQSQVAATVSALLGEDYHGAVPESAPPIAGVGRYVNP